MDLSLDNLQINMEHSCFTPDMAAIEQPVSNPEPLPIVEEVKVPEISLPQQRHIENKIRAQEVRKLSGWSGITGYQGVTGYTGYQGVTGSQGFVGATGTSDGLVCRQGLNLGEEDVFYPKIKQTSDYIEKTSYSEGFTVRTRVGKTRAC